MALSAKTIRNQLLRLKPILNRCSLDACRKGQDKLGELALAVNRKEVQVKKHPFPGFEGAWVLPRDLRRQGVVLYLHGGGYTCGGLEYALGFGSVLAVRCGVRVFCAAYRLAPEHPFPAALEDAVEAYRYLLEKGHRPEGIALCGESAGGGLCYSLCLRCRELGLPLPGSIVAISPWMDLTGSGVSYGENRDRDPTLTRELLEFYAKCYGGDRENPLVSPLFGDLTGMPPSLIFAGGDEILKSDAEGLHQLLKQSHCKSHLVVAPERWHAYVLMGLRENESDYSLMNRFWNRHLSMENKLRWVRLDNAAKIYPAARNPRWSNVFRLSATLKEPVDRQVLQSALDVTARRFPAMAARLRRGVFWYYLQQLSETPQVSQEQSYPLAMMDRDETRACALRVIAYEKRIAVEYFHSLTDGNGALVFLKTLVAEYLQQKHGITIPPEQGVLPRLEEPHREELEDSFLKYSGPVCASRAETNAWRLRGTPTEDGFAHLTCFRLPVAAVRERAREQGVTVTAWLTAVLMKALLEIQAERVPNRRRRAPVKVLVPINLRKVFPSRTLRNFAMYTIPEADPRLGDFTLEELCSIVRHKIGLDNNPKQMGKMIATNVSSERLLVVRLLPLFLKNLVMKAVFNAVGERKSCMNLSNLGLVKLPEVMEPYVERLDFILGVQATAPQNCGVIAFGDTIYVNFIRNIQEPELEARYHRLLQQQGIPVQVESNLN